MEQKRDLCRRVWPGIQALLFVAMGCVFPAGCASSLKSQYADVEKVVLERTGQRIEWGDPAPTEAARQNAIAPFLSQPLTVAEAERLALINNRSLQATLSEIGISRADLIQAGLLSNPEVFTRYRWQTRGPDASNFEFRPSEDFMSLVMMPLRRRVAKQQLEQAKAHVANAALDLACQVEIAFYTLQGQMQVRDRQSRFVEALGSATELSRRKRLIGDMSDHALLAQEIALGRARQALAGMDLQVVAARERLNRLMGLAGPEVNTWRISGELPQPPAQEPPCENLEAQAMARRMDLAAVRGETATLQETLKLQQFMNWMPIFRVGIDYERNTNKTKVLGPSFIFTVPIFDWGQARTARAKALLEQSRQKTAALEMEICSEVREACERLMAARKTVQFDRDELLPQVQRLMAATRDHPGGGGAGAGDLLKDQQDAAKAEQEYTDALRDYWTARAKLGQAVGGEFGRELVK